MNRIDDYKRLTDKIVTWIYDYCSEYNIKSLVVGVSGGIDSSVVSTLCAKTGLPTYVIGIPINQRDEQETLSDNHGEWLQNKYTNVRFIKIDLSSVNDLFLANINLQAGEQFAINKLAQANTRSRLRMVTLYQVATTLGGIVVGTGNKVEDYGVGFYTKYGDGGIDIAPIADLYKTEVWELGKYIGVDERIIDAAPTDGLWDDGRTDEDQIGTSYAMLEWVMEEGLQTAPEQLNEEELNAINVYTKFNTQNKHKMVSIPTFKL